MAKYLQQEFRQAEHPFSLNIPYENIASQYHMFVPMDVFKPGAMGWRDRASGMKGAYTYETAEQFLGEMLKFSMKHGTVDNHNQKRRCFWYTKQDADGQIITMPKLRLITELCVKRSHSSDVVNPRVLQEFELRDPKNLVGVMYHIIIHDPNVHFIDLVCDMVRENARKNPVERMRYVLEDAMPEGANMAGGLIDASDPAAVDSSVDAATSPDSVDIQNTAAESAVEEDDENQDNDTERGGRGRGGRKKGKRSRGGSSSSKSAVVRGQQQQQPKKPAERTKKWQRKTGANGSGRGGNNANARRGVDTESIPTPEEVIKKQERLYEKVDELCKAVSLFVGLCTGNHGVVDSERWLARGILLEAIRTKSDPSVDLEEAMSLQNAVSQMRKFSGQDATSVQRLAESYVSTTEASPNLMTGIGIMDGDGDDDNSNDGCGGEIAGYIQRNHVDDTPDRNTVSPAATAASNTDDDAGIDTSDLFGNVDDDNDNANGDEEEQTTPSGYVETCRKSFRVAVPDLAWEYKPVKASASCLTRSCFPWKNTNPVLSFAYIVSRCFDISVPEVLAKANISSGTLKRLSDQSSSGGTGSSSFNSSLSGGGGHRIDGKEAAFDNADYIGKAIGIGNAMDGEYVDSMIGFSADDELAMKSGQLSIKTISHIRVVGTGCTAIRNCALRIYMENRMMYTELRKGARMEAAKRKKKGTSSSSSAATNWNSTMDDDEGDGVSYLGRTMKSLMIQNGDGTTTTPERRGGRRAVAITMQDKDIKTSIRLNKTRLRKSMREISCCALSHLVSLSDITATIPESVKNCFMWLDSQRKVQLSYRPRASNLDAFGTILTSDMIAFRQLGIAVNQHVFRWLQISRDSGYLRYNLPVHLKLMGKYASGKSILFVLLGMCSVYRSVVILTGSSNMGIMPTNGSPTKPIGDVMYCFDEMLGLMTDVSSKLNSDERKVAKMLSSMMTAGRVEYITTDKIDDKLVQVTKIIDATPVFAGGTNASDESTVVGARMVSMYVRPDVEGPRCSVHLICDPWMSNGRNKARAEQVSEQYKMHHSLVLSACKAIEAGGLPNPDDTLFLTYLECTVELLKHNFPDVVEHVRMVDIARPTGATLQVETAVAMVFSPAMLGKDVCGGNKFSLGMCRELAPYLRVSESVAMYVIAFVVHSSSDPLGHKVLRWMSEFIGNYPFVSMHKKAMITIQRNARSDTSGNGDSDGSQNDHHITINHKKKKQAHSATATAAAIDEDDEQQQQQQQGDEDVDADADDSTIDLGPDVDGISSNTNSSDADADANDMREMEMWFEGIKTMLTHMPCAEIEMQLSRRKKSGSSRANDAVLKTLRRAEAEKLSPEAIAVLKHNASMGTTVPYPLKPKESNRKDLNKAAHDLLEGIVTIPKYDYKCEVIKMQDGQSRLYVNMNYIKVPGSADSFAETYMFTNRNSKLTTADVKTVLSRLSRKQVPAHLINLVPMDNPDILVGVEANRVRLWFTDGCSIEATVPVMLPGPDCWYILVEALLSSPMHIVTRVLDNLCNETTVERSIPLPVPDDRFPFLLRTYEARPIPGRKLRCANPTHVGKVELETLPETIEDTLNSVGLGVNAPRIIEWSHDAELRAIKRFFMENGIESKPEDYTEAAMAAAFSRTRFEQQKKKATTTSSSTKPCIYPDAYIAEAMKLDNSAKDIMNKSDMKYRSAAQRPTMTPMRNRDNGDDE